MLTGSLLELPWGSLDAAWLFLGWGLVVGGPRINDWRFSAGFSCALEDIMPSRCPSPAAVFVPWFCFRCSLHVSDVFWVHLGCSLAVPWMSLAPYMSRMCLKRTLDAAWRFLGWALMGLGGASQAVLIKSKCWTMFHHVEDQGSLQCEHKDMSVN